MSSVTSTQRDDSEGRDLLRVLRLLIGHRRYAHLQIALSLLEGFLEAAILTLFARLALLTVEGGAGFVYVPGVGSRSTSFALTMLVFLIVARLIVAIGAIWSSSRLQFRLVRSFRDSAVRSYTEATWSTQDQMDHGALQQLVVTVPNGIGSNLSGLISYLSQFSIMASMLVYALLTDLKLTSALIVIIGLSTFAFKPLRKWIRIRSSRAIAEQQNLSRSTAELSDMKFEIHAFGVGQKIRDPILDLVRRESSFQESASRIRATIVPVFTSILYLTVTLGLIVLARSSADNFEQTGPILLVVLRSLSYGVAIQQAASGVASVIPSINFFERELSKLNSSQRSWGDISFVGCSSLVFDRVNYRYPNTSEMALKDVTAVFKVGGKVGIVGPSGGGKTTLARAALGVIDPMSGHVFLNGSDIRNFDRKSLYRSVAVVPQSATMLRGTIEQNLVLFREGISEEDMWGALRLADLESEIRGLPDGLKTMIGTGHLQLSGGQQQRLAIARAFAGRPELVVMDEPTSSVDALSEALISEAIDNLPRGVTVLIVSHRMRILEGCDQLIVVEGGRVSAIGVPEEILRESDYAQALDLK